MEKLIKFIIGALGAAVLLAFIATLGGTILWLIWPVAIPAAFPGFVEKSFLAAQMTWWQSVCLVWLFGILIKSGKPTTKD